MRKSKMLPFLPDEKSNHIAFWSLTQNDGVFSLLNGDSPFHSRPALRNFTRRPTTSETGSRARSSSRNCGVKRMVIRVSVPPKPLQYMAGAIRGQLAGRSPHLVPVIHRSAPHTSRPAIAGRGDRAKSAFTRVFNVNVAV